jgi:protein-S-isoprenylcysteine O-methyltransferase Ste14
MSLFSFLTKEEPVTTLEQLEIAKGKIQLTMMKMIAFVLGSVMVSVVLVMMVGLFTPNHVIDNNEIFKIIGPAFSTIVGAFVGAFATMMGMKTAEFDPNVKQQELGKTNYKDIAEADRIEAETERYEYETRAKYLVDDDDDDDHGPF